ncbi:MAG TPA: NBR1-Ig-like domain-containing protein [Anaerolineales bacterium]|nr:NBR1-Ig-like domain-containing protein [Anaerolineales bacterium]
MKLNTNSVLILFGILAFAIMACFPVTLMAMPLMQSDQPDTNDAAATVQAIVTQTMYAMTQNAPTSIPVTVTPIPATSTPVPPTNTPVPTAVSYCDWVAFIKDVSIPDGAQLSAGEVFTKTWRLQNRGTCTWTSDYMLVYTGGDQMGSTTAVRLPGNVAPGQTVDVSVTLTAPASAGYHVSYWMLRNPSGALFGTGGKANEAFYVEIKTLVEQSHGTVSGALCYPSEFNPPLTLYFEKAGTNETIQFFMPESQNFFNVLLPNGRYYAYAWAPGYNLEGAYTDSTGVMRTFAVNGGQTTTNVNLCDWSPYAHERGQ